jgi:hypothetical protein
MRNFNKFFDIYGTVNGERVAVQYDSIISVVVPVPETSHHASPQSRSNGVGGSQDKFLEIDANILLV